MWRVNERDHISKLLLNHGTLRWDKVSAGFDEMFGATKGRGHSKRPGHSKGDLMDMACHELYHLAANMPAQPRRERSLAAQTLATLMSAVRDGHGVPPADAESIAEALLELDPEGAVAAVPVLTEDHVNSKGKTVPRYTTGGGDAGSPLWLPPVVTEKPLDAAKNVSSLAVTRMRRVFLMDKLGQALAALHSGDEAVATLALQGIKDACAEPMVMYPWWNQPRADIALMECVHEHGYGMYDSILTSEKHRPVVEAVWEEWKEQQQGDHRQQKQNAEGEQQGQEGEEEKHEVKQQEDEGQNAQQQKQQRVAGDAGKGGIGADWPQFEYFTKRLRKVVNAVTRATERAGKDAAASLAQQAAMDAIVEMATKAEMARLAGQPYSARLPTFVGGGEDTCTEAVRLNPFSTAQAKAFEKARRNQQAFTNKDKLKLADVLESHGMPRLRSGEPDFSQLRVILGPNFGHKWLCAVAEAYVQLWKAADDSEKQTADYMQDKKQLASPAGAGADGGGDVDPDGDSDEEMGTGADGVAGDAQDPSRSEPGPEGTGTTTSPETKKPKLKRQLISYSKAKRMRKHCAIMDILQKVLCLSSDWRQRPIRLTKPPRARLPGWWVCGTHDRELALAVLKHGANDVKAIWADPDFSFAASAEGGAAGASVDAASPAKGRDGDAEAAAGNAGAGAGDQAAAVPAPEPEASPAAAAATTDAEARDESGDDEQGDDGDDAADGAADGGGHCAGNFPAAKDAVRRLRIMSTHFERIMEQLVRRAEREGERQKLVALREAEGSKRKRARNYAKAPRKKAALGAGTSIAGSLPSGTSEGTAMDSVGLDPFAAAAAAAAAQFAAECAGNAAGTGPHAP